MKAIWESIRFFVLSHKVASIAVASVVGVSAIGAGSYGIYNLVSAKDNAVDEVVEVDDSNAADDVYIPEFKNVVITSESLEKDLTIYISDENDNPVLGVPFQVKMLTAEDAAGLQTYIDAIKDIDAQIAEYTSSYADVSVDATSDTTVDATEETSDDEDVATDEKEVTATASNAAGLEAIKRQQAKQNGAAKATAEQAAENANKSEESKAKSDDAASDSTESAETEEGDSIGVDSSALPSDADKIRQILKDRNVAVTVTDEDGDVVETQTTDVTDDPLYQLILDKETAVQSYTVALQEAKGELYTDDDEDGVIAQTEMEPGDYVLCLMNDIDSEVSYEPTSYTTDANVKDKVEFKVQKEITKQIKKDVASEDGQKTEAVPVEETLKDTVEFVESKKVESGGSAKSTTDVAAPTSTASSSKATVKSGGNTKVTHVVKAIVTYTVTINYVDQDGNKLADTTNDTKVKKGETITVTPKAIDGYDAPASQNITGEKDVTITFKYTKKSSGNSESGGSGTSDGTSDGSSEGGKTDNTENKSDTDTETKSDSDTEGGSEGGTTETNTEARRTKLNGAVAVRGILTAATTDTTETATLDMSYSAGTFTISATTNVGSVTVNGTAVTMKDGKGTFSATKDGDYTLKGVATFSDGATDSGLTVTYTVSGFGTASTDRLKDKSGNELFLDEALTKPATVADYKAGQTYYYKQASYTYYGWQSIDGNTYFFDKNGNKVTGDQVIQGVKYSFGSDGVLVIKGNGIDVSKYQGNIDWKSAKSAVNFAIVRCGYRGMYDGQLHEDPYFYKNMSGAKAAGINVGVYIYSTALSEAEAVQEASMAVAMTSKAGGCSYPIYLDMEDTVRGQSKLSVDQRMAIVNAFVSTVQSSGYKAGLYCSKNWMTARMNANAIPSSCSIWIAQYNTSCTYSGRKNMWQYSSKGSVPGIKGNVDMNKSF